MGEHCAHRTRQPGPARPSWCYGTPGLARAQQLAALALDDPQRQQTAENALLSCITDTEQFATLTNASLCHGWTGLTLATTRAAADARTTALTDHLPALKARLTLQATTSLEQPGLLEGSAGVELTRTLQPDNPRTWTWDACLLTAG
ncbi:lanthionine synthetase LanC family protein [Actinomadura sp. NBRC 104425]|uniref:lanthionine synthetase LanC family protein n=1 Tax=Actinomadura sp. NBRC 104425 TaxID=3032204 RepID=UPI00331B9541